MRWTLLVVAALLAVPAFGANDVFIAQNAAGANNGSDCADAKAVSYFNTAGNWSATPTGIQIGPGTTVHLCGTFTGTAGSTMMTVQGDGAVGNVVLIHGETGSLLTSPIWAGNPNGALALGSHSNITVEFVTVQNTANGTGLANQSGSYGITTAGGSNIILRNNTITNMYLRVCCGHELNDGSSVQAIHLSGGSNITVQNNTINMVGWGINADSTLDNLIVSGNDVGNAVHNVAPGGPHWKVFNNHFHDWAVWASDNDQYHLDALHCFSDSTGHTLLGEFYNNRMDGSMTTNMNQFVFLEGNISSTRCGAPGATFHIFNNIAISNGDQVAILAVYGNATTGDVNDVIVNNTVLNSVPNTPPNPRASTANINCQNALNTLIANNASGGSAVLVGGGGSFPCTFTQFDYNAYENCNTAIPPAPGSFNCWSLFGSGTSSFTTWQSRSCTGSANTCDQHGIANVGPQPPTLPNYFLLDPSCVPGSLNSSCSLQPQSPLRSAGTNLNSICSGQPNPGLGALCFDINGFPRPSTGAWDIGATQFTVLTPHGPSGYMNGYGLGDGPITVTRTNANCTEINAGGTPCQDPDFPLGGPGAGSQLLPGATHTVYVTCVDTNWLTQAWNIDNSFGGTLAVAKTISALGAADSSLNVLSYDASVFAFTTSFGGRGWFSNFNPTTGACSPLREEGNNGFNFGGGVPEFSKVPINGNGHIAYGYCSNPFHAGLCQEDPFTGVVTQLVDFTVNGNFPSGALPSGVGGEIDCTRDLLGQGVGTECVLSIGTGGEVENAWRYDVHVLMSNPSQCVQWWDVKQDITGGSTNCPVNWPNSSAGQVVQCNTPAVTVGLCTGLASAPSSTINATTCPPSGTLVQCQGIHGVGAAVGASGSIYSNVSLEGFGPTFFTSGKPTSCAGTTVTSGLCAVVSTVLNGAGHRTSAGTGSYGYNSGTPGTIQAMQNDAPTIRTFQANTVGNPGTDGHDSGNASDQNLNGMLFFGSFYNGLATASHTPGLVGNGTTLTVTCSNNPCFYANSPSLRIQGSSVSGFNGTWTITGPNGTTGNGGNTVQVSNTTVGSDTGGTAALFVTNCPFPTASGMDEEVAYSFAPGDLDSNNIQRNNRIVHLMMDTCANNQNFYNLTNPPVNVQGTWLGPMATNLNCTLGNDNAGNCRKIIQFVELVPNTAGGSPTVTLNPNSINFGIQLIGQTSPQQIVTLSNVGTESLSISSISITGTNAAQFALVTPNSGTDCRIIGTVPAGGNCNIAATFTPNAVQVFNESINITDNAANSPQSVTLTGQGIPNFAPAPQSFSIKVSALINSLLRRTA